MIRPVEKAIAGKYEILEKIREGGMGAIYKVRHRLLDEVRIVKVLRSDLAMDETLRQRFQNEAKFAIQLRHPHIAHLYDFSVSDDATSAYIVMEYIDGVTLQELIAESGPPTLGLAVEIASQALRAIGHLHQQGFVHRDVASDNLMLTRDFQGDPLVKLIDLGIAKGQEQDLNLTATGIFMGKVRYSAPELFKDTGGAAALDERSDIYSFGVLLYELLTGQSPVSGQSFSEIVAGHLFRPPLSFEESDPDGTIPPGLRELTLAALEKDPGKRLASAEEFLERLVEFGTDEPSHSDEFARAIEATAQLATLKPKTSAGPSTQDRLDRQFGMEDPSSHPEELAEEKDEAVAQAASAIRERTRVGQVTKAKEDLELATSLYGDHSELAAVRREIGESPAARAAPTPSRDRRRGRAPLARLKSPLTLALAAALAVVAGALLWALSGRSGDPAPAPAEGPVLVELAPRWTADGQGEPFFDPPPSLADDPALREPPPVPPEAGGAESAEPSSPVASPEPGGPAPAGEPAGPEAVEPGAEPAPKPAEPAAQEAPTVPAPEVRRGELFGPDPGVTPPSLVQVPVPAYRPGFDAPKEALDLMVEVLVNEDGQVITARLAPRESGKRRFKELAVETARGATFRPATKHGVAGKMWATIRVTLPAG